MVSSTSRCADDLRGRMVMDRNGEEVGMIQGLLIERGDGTGRFLVVRGVGFVGVGAKTVLIPIDAVSSVDGTRVSLDQDRGHVGGGPSYDERLLSEGGYFAAVYGWYGLKPHRLPGDVSTAGRVPSRAAGHTEE